MKIQLERAKQTEREVELRKWRKQGQKETEILGKRETEVENSAQTRRKKERNGNCRESHRLPSPAPAKLSANSQHQLSATCMSYLRS